MTAERLAIGLVALGAGCAGSDYDLSYCKAPGLVVNEVSAAAVDEDGEDDFIELYNDDVEAVDVSGWAISRVATWREYELPELEPLAPGAFLEVLAMPYRPDDGSLATGYDLNRDGDGVWLQDDDGALCDYLLYPDQHASFSWGRPTDGRPEPDEAPGCYQSPTPGGRNDPCLDVEMSP